MTELVTVSNTELTETNNVQRLIEIAINKDADIDKLERLLAMQERYEQNQAKKRYLIAMANFKAECPSIAKTRQGHNCTYAGLAETIDQIKSLLSKNGFCFSWKVDQSEKDIRVTCYLHHIEGFSETATLSGSPDTSGSKNSIQAVGSTVSYLERYTLFAILGLSSMESDTDGFLEKDTISNEQIEVINKKLSQVDKKKFSGWLKSVHGVEQVESIPKEKFNVIITTLNTTINNKKKKESENGDS